MRIFIQYSLIFLCIVIVSGCSARKKVEKNPLIDSIISEVSTQNIKSSITDLVGFETRYPYDKQIKSAEYIYERLYQYLDKVNYHTYEYWGVEWKNVVGTIEGNKYPEQTIVVCAHFDTKSEKQLVYAPGADDNASGCAGVIELARILSKYSFEKTLKFIFFSRESTGQNGSNAYVKSINRDKLKIIAALNMDMIAYGPADEDIDLVTRPEYAWLADTAFSVSRAYGFNVRKIVKKQCY